MISPTDKDYQETKLIKQGKTFINSHFKALAEWLDNRYNVQVLNICFDVKTGSYNKPFPRLSIIFENLEDELKFRDGRLGNYDVEKQNTVAGKFDEILNVQSTDHTIALASVTKEIKYKYDINDLLVIFDAFKPVAKEEANEGIPEFEIESLLTSINNPTVWKLKRFAAGATFFFYSSEQASSAKSSGYIYLLTDQYFDVLKRYDEFDYFERKTFTVGVDSKENFEKKYVGNWFYYFR